MAYTLDYFYKKFLNKIDKEGSDFYSLPQIMEFLETETISFIKEVEIYPEVTQTRKELVLPLVEPLDVSLVVNPANVKEYLGTMPADYLMLRSVNKSGDNVRKTSTVRIAEIDIAEINPNKKGTSMYPNVYQYSNYFAVYGASPGDKLYGFYLQKPTFGDPTGDLEQEITVNLPDQALEEIMNMMVVSINSKEGDQRYQASKLQEESFGHVK